MRIKNIVVMLDESLASVERVEAAITAAKKYDAHLTGVFSQPQEIIPADLKKLILSVEIKESIKSQGLEALEQASKNIKATFDFKTEQAGIADKAHWFTVDADPNVIASMISRTADIVFMGMPADAETTSAVDPEDVVFSCGRPLLVFPKEYKFKALTEHAVIAWNGSREAARALADALPILESKKKVSLVCVKSDYESAGAGDSPHDVIEHLHRHGINAEKVVLESRKKDVGADILAFVAESDADLLVMGAYGRARWKEKILGGATQSILKGMTVPVLMSH